MSERRKQRKARRTEAVNGERQRRVRGILATLGLWERLERTSLGDRLLNSHYPQVRVQPSADLPLSEETTRILRELTKAAKKATFKCPLLGDTFPVLDYCSFAKPIMDILGAAASPQPDLQSFLMKAMEGTRELGSPETGANAIITLFDVLEEVLLRYGRIDQYLYYLTVEHGRQANQKWYVKFFLHREPAQQRKVIKDNNARVVFRCGQPNGLSGIEWVEWPESIFGGEDRGRKYPVYVQSHALDNLYRREARALFIEDGEWLVHDYLWQSLMDAKPIPMPFQTGKYLVEYYLNIHKIGYLVVSRLETIVVVDSFLFLTMDGTPEGDRLWDMLRLSKRDKKYLGLDSIRTFLFTDVQFDTELVQLLTDCGCGHLFKVMKEPPKERHIGGYARDIRKHLRLDGS